MRVCTGRKDLGKKDWEKEVIIKGFNKSRIMYFLALLIIIFCTLKFHHQTWQEASGTNVMEPGCCQVTMTTIVCS